MNPELLHLLAVERHGTLLHEAQRERQLNAYTPEPTERPAVRTTRRSAPTPCPTC